MTAFLAAVAGRTYSYTFAIGTKKRTCAVKLLQNNSTVATTGNVTN
ncbi:hypothetical protein ACQPZJ_16515 [Actinoplanes sp. CA-054009]